MRVHADDPCRLHVLPDLVRHLNSLPHLCYLMCAVTYRSRRVCIVAFKYSGSLRPKQVVSAGAQTLSRAVGPRVTSSVSHAYSGCYQHLVFRIILQYVAVFQPRVPFSFSGERLIHYQHYKRLTTNRDTTLGISPFISSK